MTDKNTSESELDALYSAISALSDTEECRRFFEDLCTDAELRAFSQRLDVAKRLRGGQPFARICAETGASTATISRVSRALSHGSGGYVSLLNRLCR